MNDAAPVVGYALNAYVFATGVPVNLVAGSSGGAVLSWSIDRTLPAGLTFNTTSGDIHGTPTQSTAQGTYVVSAQNSGGTGTFNLTLTVATPSADAGLLLDLGHADRISSIVHDGTRILSMDTRGRVVLWNAQTGGNIANTTASCSFPCTPGPLMALSGPTVVIKRQGGFEVWSSIDGTVVASTAKPPRASARCICSTALPSGRMPRAPSTHPCLSVSRRTEP